MSNFLSMSDEQILATGGIMPPVAEQTNTTEVAAPAPDAAEQAVVEEAVVTEPASQAEAVSDAENAEVSEAEEQGDADDDNVEPAEQVAEATAEPQTAEAVTEAAGLPEGAQRIFETFRANGRDMKVKSVDEAIRLMQMGANYSQKQAARKKDRSFVKVLEQNDLLDHEKLAFAVDLIKGNPEAIGKLIKDTNFDVHEIDEAKVAQYQATSKAPSTKTLEIEEVISEIQDHKQFGRLSTEMRTWDEESQALLGQHPKSMSQLVEQMENGIYDTIMDEVNRRSVLGLLGGTPIMQAYNAIGSEMAAAGAFSKPAPTAAVTKLVTPSKKTSVTDKATEERRRAAAPSKGASTVETAPAKPDFLNMSDDDFANLNKR